MIGYVCLGTNDIGKAAAFYDELLKLVGAERMMESETFIAWGNNPKAAALSVNKPHDGNQASVGNGIMVAIAVREPDQVDALHAKALELGGADEGAPGFRTNSFYAGYFRDPDGNKLNAFCFKQQ